MGIAANTSAELNEPLSLWHERMDYTPMVKR
jgi:hypothetical protein